MTNLLPCPNPECESRGAASPLLEKQYRGDAVSVRCYHCEMRGPEAWAGKDSTDEQNWAEAIRLWSLLPREDMRLVDRVNELVQAEEALNEENVRLQCELDDLREELSKAREEPVDCGE